MASCKCKFRWKRWRRPGYRDVLNSGPVQSLVRSKAREIERSHGEGYETVTIKGILARGCLVRPIELTGEKPKWPTAEKRKRDKKKRNGKR